MANSLWALIDSNCSIPGADAAPVQWFRSEAEARAAVSNTGQWAEFLPINTLYRSDTGGEWVQSGEITLHPYEKVNVTIATKTGDRNVDMVTVQVEKDQAYLMIFSSGYLSHLMRIKFKPEELKLFGRELYKLAANKKDKAYPFSGVSQAYEDGHPGLGKALDLTAEFFRFHIKSDDVALWRSILKAIDAD